MAGLYCLWFLTRVKQWFMARGLEWSLGDFFLPSYSHICHFLSTPTDSSFISVICTSLISDLLTPNFHFSNPFSIPPLKWDGLKQNFDHVPLLLVTFPGSSRPVEWSWSLNSSGRNWRRSTICPTVPSHSAFLLTLMPKMTHCPSLLSPPTYPQPFPQVFALLSWPKSSLSPPSPVQISPPLWCWSPISSAGSGSPCLKSYCTFYWYLGIGICSLPGTICYHVIRYSYMEALFFLREYSLFIARYCVFCFLESLSEGSDFYSQGVSCIYKIFNTFHVMSS